VGLFDNDQQVARDLLLCHTLDTIPIDDLESIGMKFIRKSFRQLSYSGIKECGFYAAALNVGKWLDQQSKDADTRDVAVHRSLNPDNVVQVALSLASSHEETWLTAWLTGTKAVDRALFYLNHLERLVALATVGELLEFFGLNAHKDLDLTMRIQCLSFAFCRSEVQRMLIEVTPCGEDCMKKLAQSMGSVNLAKSVNFLENMGLESLNALRCLFSRPHSTTQFEALLTSVWNGFQSPYLYFTVEVGLHYPMDSRE